MGQQHITVVEEGTSDFEVAQTDVVSQAVPSSPNGGYSMASDGIVSTFSGLCLSTNIRTDVRGDQEGVARSCFAVRRCDVTDTVKHLGSTSEFYGMQRIVFRYVHAWYHNLSRGVMSRKR